MGKWALLNKTILNKSVQVLIVTISIVLLQACSITEKHNLGSKTNQKLHPPKDESSFSLTEKTIKLPIIPPEGEFFRVGGWLSDTEIIYITNKEQTSSLYKYNLRLGKSELLYKSDNPIVMTEVSPSEKFILIQSSPSTYEGIITVIDTKGKTRWSKPIPSFELEFAWNPYNESQILVTSFKEDWTFQNYLVDLKTEKLTAISLPQPFVKWINSKQIAYINWDQNNPSLSAPLITRGLLDEKEHTAFQKIYQFSAFKDVLMSITVNDNDKTTANYTFYDQKFHSFFSFSMPQLTKFSDWLVPYYDFSNNKDTFITFRPLRSTEADVYSDGFQLVSFNVKKGSSTVLFEGLENEPLNCSPSGNVCLYGGSYEKLIHLHTKKIVNLVKEE